MLALSLVAIALSTATPHSVQMEHRGTPMDVTYRPAVTLTLKQVGMAVPTRTDTTRCMWTARIGVERTVRKNGGSLRHPVGAHGWMEGSRPGDCRAARPSIEAEVAARGADVQAHLTRVAAADRPAVMADVDAAVAMAAQ